MIRHCISCNRILRGHWSQVHCSRCYRKQPKQKPARCAICGRRHIPSKQQTFTGYVGKRCQGPERTPAGLVEMPLLDPKRGPKMAWDEDDWPPRKVQITWKEIAE